MNTKTLDDNWLSAMELANRYNVSQDLIRQWYRYESFPRGHRQRIGARVYWNAAKVDEWLRNRPIKKTGPRPSWLLIVRHPLAEIDQNCIS